MPYLHRKIVYSMQLYNKLSAAERTELIDQSGRQRLTLSFYAYSKIQNPQVFRNELFLAWHPLDVLGRIYVATEGINAQLSLPADQFYDFKNTLDAYPFMHNIRLNIAVEHFDHSFLKLTIKVRNKIVADGLSDDLLDVTNIGIHLKANEFNKLLENPDTIVVDMRNHYESEIGHFVGAITPDVETFRESLPIIEKQLADHKNDKNLLMYCTGGIRCEKASAYFKSKGFKNVYQLEGGIIEYTRQIKAEGLESKFIGKNFVFDQRLGERITNDVISKCHQCGTPCDNHTNCVNDGCHLLFIQCELCQQKMDNCCSVECKTIISMPLVDQINLRKGISKGNSIFKKGKSDKLATFKNDDYLELKTTQKSIAIIKKVFVGKGLHYFSRPQVGLFSVDNHKISFGSKAVICGPTTGEQYITIPKMLVNGVALDTAEIGDRISFIVPFCIRSSDKLFLIKE